MYQLLGRQHHISRNHLAHRQGDAVNAVLAAAGYNFRLLLGWLAILLRRILSALLAALMPATAPNTQPKSA